MPFHDKIFYSNEYSLAKIRFDTAENEPLKVCQKIAKSYKNVRKNIGAHPRGVAARVDELQGAPRAEGGPREEEGHREGPGIAVHFSRGGCQIWLGEKVV